MISIFTVRPVTSTIKRVREVLIMRKPFWKFLFVAKRRRPKILKIRRERGIKILKMWTRRKKKKTTNPQNLTPDT